MSYGAKAGGFNPTVPQTTTGVILPISTLKVRPEKALDYEVGVKDELLDHRLIVNLDAYWTDVFGYQANTVQPNATGGAAIGRSPMSARCAAAAWKAKSRPCRSTDLKLNASAAFDDATYRNFAAAPAVQGSVATTQDLSGRPVVQSPKWTVNLGATYTQPDRRRVDAYLGADLGFKSSSFGYIDDSSLQPRRRLWRGQSAHRR